MSPTLDHHNELSGTFDYDDDFNEYYGNGLSKNPIETNTKVFDVKKELNKFKCKKSESKADHDNVERWQQKQKEILESNIPERIFQHTLKDSNVMFRYWPDKDLITIYLEESKIRDITKFYNIYDGRLQTKLTKSLALISCKDESEIDIKDIIRFEYNMWLKDNPKIVIQEPKDIPTPEYIIERADEIELHGDPVEFILDIHQTLHIGDRKSAAVLLLSTGSQCVKNSNGLHPKPTGDTGKGKTHLMDTIMFLFPDDIILKLTLSNKAMYYMDNLKPGTVIYLDDVNLTSDLEDLIKRTTSQFHNETVYETVDKDRKIQKLTIPSGIVWWLNSVDDVDTRQLLNRQFNISIDESIELDESVFQNQVDEAINGNTEFIETDDVLVCRELISRIRKNFIEVKIPFANDIHWSDKNNRRNFHMFLDMIKSFTVFRHKQRIVDDDGYLLADIQDFRDSATLYNIKAKNQKVKLNDQEIKICEFISNQYDKYIYPYEKGEVTELDIADHLCVTRGRIYQLMHGSKNKPESGLMFKVPGLVSEEVTMNVENSINNQRVKKWIHSLNTDWIDQLEDINTIVCLKSDISNDPEWNSTIIKKIPPSSLFD